MIGYARDVASERECRIVVFGPLGAGKTTCVKCFERFTTTRTKPLSFRPEALRTTRLDFIATDVPVVDGRKTRVFLSTVSGWAYDQVDRKQLLEKVDGVIFVADSAPARAAANEESLAELQAILREHGREPASVPTVLLYNKRDRKDAVPVPTLDARLNPTGLPTFESAVGRRAGVQEALRKLLHEICAVPDPIVWEATGDDGIPFRALVGAKRLYVKHGATVTDPLYTLIVDGEATETHTTWPEHWVQPRVRVGDRPVAAQAPVPQAPPAPASPQTSRHVAIEYELPRSPPRNVAAHVPPKLDAQNGKVAERAGRVIYLHGKLQFRCGLPVGIVLVAAVTVGPDPILLGWGLAHESFSIGFDRAMLDDPTGPLPPVEAIFSIMDRDQQFVPVHRHVVEPDHVVSRSGGIGTIILPLRKNDTPRAVKGLERIPGIDKPRRRLRLDDELVQFVSLLAAPFTEEETGWAKLLSGIRFEIVDDYVAPVRRRTEILLGRSTFEEHEQALITHAGQTLDAFALWSELESIVYLNRPALEQQSVAFLFVAVAHELVHVGQSKHHPETDVEWKRHAQTIWTHHLAGTTPPKELAADLFGLMANLEGYAKWVQNRLALSFTGSMQLVSEDVEIVASAPPPRVHTDLDALAEPDAPPSLRSVVMSQKSAQYDSGYRAYAARVRHGQKLVFDPALRPPPLAAEDLLKPLMKRALTGDTYSQMSLGDLYRTGEMVGLVADRAKARRWYRLAVASGSEEAKKRLAALETEASA